MEKSGGFRSSRYTTTRITSGRKVRAGLDARARRLKEMIRMAEFAKFVTVDLRPFMAAVDRSAANLAAVTIPQRAPQGPPKRSDLSTERLLREVARHGIGAWDRLTAEFPSEVVLAAFRRDVDRGFLDYGTWEGHPWLTPEGEAYLNG